MRSDGPSATDESWPAAGVPTPSVSVLVANYNAERFLEACLRSILAQQDVDVDIVLVDDVSTDGGVAIARRIAHEDDRLRIVEMPRNGGPAAARNRALSLARGDWIAIVDSDDLLHPQRFARLIAAAQAAGADMVADDLLVFTDGSDASPQRFLKASDRGAPFGITLADYLQRSVLYGAQPNPGFLKPLIRRDRLASSGVRYDESLRIAEDDDLAVRLLLAGCAYLIVPTPWYFYRKHGGSISHRLSLTAVEAMQAADRRVAAAAMARDPALEPELAARRRALDRAAAFERLIAALRARRLFAAAAVLARHLAMAPMLRMPIAGFARRLRRRRPPPPIAPAEQAAALLAAAEKAGAGTVSPTRSAAAPDGALTGEVSGKEGIAS